MARITIRNLEGYIPVGNILKDDFNSNLTLEYISRRIANHLRSVSRNYIIVSIEDFKLNIPFNVIGTNFLIKYSTVHILCNIYKQVDDPVLVIEREGYESLNNWLRYSNAFNLQSKVSLRTLKVGDIILDSSKLSWVIESLEF